MSWGQIVILDSELGAKVFEFQVVELLSNPIPMLLGFRICILWNAKRSYAPFAL